MIAERENIPCGGDVPHVHPEKNIQLYKEFAAAGDMGLIASAISVGRGGLIAAFSKSAMAGRLGVDADISDLRGNAKNTTEKLFSESQGRILVSVAHGNARMFDLGRKNYFDSYSAAFTGLPKHLRRILI